MSVTLKSLNEHLFSELESLDEHKYNADKLDLLLKKAKTKNELIKTIQTSIKLELEAIRFAESKGMANCELPSAFEGKRSNNVIK